MKKCHTPETFKTALLKSGIRPTAKRIRILALLHRAHVASADEIYSADKARLDRVTVYRTLQTLEEAGIVRRVALSPKSTSYELADHHAHYLVCTHCGRYEALSSCALSSLDQKAAKESKHFKKIDGHSLQFFGSCKECDRA